MPLDRHPRISLLEKETTLIRYAVDYMLECARNPDYRLSPAERERFHAYCRIYAECNASARRALMELEKRQTH